MVFSKIRDTGDVSLKGFPKFEVPRHPFGQVGLCLKLRRQVWAAQGGSN